MRASWLTDIHLNFLRPLALQAFYDRVRAEQPQVLLVTGDIGEADSVGRFLDELAAIAPVYFVLGNHDYYRSSIAAVRGQMERLDGAATWLPAHEPLRITPRCTMLGVDGWGDARCGDLASTVQLSDWQVIDDFKRLRGDRASRDSHDLGAARDALAGTPATTAAARDSRAVKETRAARIELLQRLGSNEARALRERLAQAPDTEHLLVLTHVPPFPEACVYAGEPSDPAWLPWFTCVATGEVLAEYAAAHPAQQITVLCGHSHGAGTCHPLPNLEVRTGGWPPDVADYGNPLVQATLEL